MSYNELISWLWLGSSKSTDVLLVQILLGIFMFFINSCVFFKALSPTIFNACIITSSVAACIIIVIAWVKVDGEIFVNFGFGFFIGIVFMSIGASIGATNYSMMQSTDFSASVTKPQNTDKYLFAFDDEPLVAFNYTGYIKGGLYGYCVAPITSNYSIQDVYVYALCKLKRINYPLYETCPSSDPCISRWKEPIGFGVRVHHDATSEHYANNAANNVSKTFDIINNYPLLFVEWDSPSNQMKHWQKVLLLWTILPNALWILLTTYTCYFKCTKDYYY